MACQSLYPVGVWSDLIGSSYSERLEWLPDAHIDWRRGALSKWNDTELWPESRCSAPCLKGNWRHFPDPTLIQCCWECVRCESTLISNITNSDRCFNCREGFRPNSNQTECLEIEPSYLGKGNGWNIAIMVISYIGTAVALITLVLFWKWKESPLVLASDLRITTAILVGMIVGGLLTNLLTGKPTDSLCSAQVFLVTPWPTFAVAGVLCKTNRLARLFSRKTLYRGRFRRKLLGTPAQFCLMLALTFVQVLLVVLSEVLTRPTAVTIYDSPVTALLVCTADNGWRGVILAYNLILILITLVLAYQTRKLPENYNEARLIFMASFCVLVVWLGLSPAYFVTATEMTPIVAAFSVNVVFSAIWSCLYAPRLYVLIRHPEKRHRSLSTVKRLVLAGSSKTNSFHNSHSFHQDSTVSAHNTNHRKSVEELDHNSSLIQHSSSESPALNHSRPEPAEECHTNTHAPVHQSEESGRKKAPISTEV